MKIRIKDFVGEVQGVAGEDLATSTVINTLARWKIPTIKSEPTASGKVYQFVDVKYLDKARERYAAEQVKVDRVKQKRANGHDKPHPVTEISRKLDILSSELAALTKWLQEREARILTTKE